MLRFYSICIPYGEIKWRIILLCLFTNLGITVALQLTSYTTLETDGPLSVCIEMFTGNLERNVSLSVSTVDGSAVGTFSI